MLDGTGDESFPVCSKADMAFTEVGTQLHEFLRYECLD